jgi:hypothetical protein
MKQAPKTEPVKFLALCAKCLSGDIVADAEAVWNCTSQKWELKEVHLEQRMPIGHCNACDDSCSVEMFATDLVDDQTELAILKLQRLCRTNDAIRPVIEEVSRLLRKHRSEAASDA